jgi:hypothetical protein
MVGPLLAGVGSMADRIRQEEEALQRILDPHRAEEQRKAREEAEFRLTSRGIVVLPTDSDEEIADLLDKIEIFEMEVERLGGDLMVNRIRSSKPEDPAFVPPARQPEEPIPTYLKRLERALAALQERRRRREEAR